MAIIKCPECGQDVSDKAASCIHCGAPLNHMDAGQAVVSHSKSNKNIVACVLGVIGAVANVAAMYLCLDASDVVLVGILFMVVDALLVLLVVSNFVKFIPAKYAKIICVICLALDIISTTLMIILVEDLVEMFMCGLGWAILAGPILTVIASINFLQVISNGDYE